MAQVFPRSANRFAWISIIGVILVVGAGVGFLVLAPMSYVPAAPAQPVPFSHQQHAGNLGIDCRYCHTTVQTSAFAGMPSTLVCMNCHTEVIPDNEALAPVQARAASGKPIAWNQVYVLPDFAYFDHSAHVNKGVA